MTWLFFLLFSLYLAIALYLSTFLFRPAKNLMVWFATLTVFSYPFQIVILTTLGLAGQFYFSDFQNSSHIIWTTVNTSLALTLIGVHLRPVLWYLFNFDFMEFHIQGVFPVKDFKPHHPNPLRLLNWNKSHWPQKETGSVTTRDGSQLLYDLWMNPNANAPMVIQLFGGGYTIGSKDQLPHFTRLMVETGYHVICPNYRLMPKHVWPTPANDIEDFWNALPNIQESKKLNPQFYVFSGRSAGSHLASYSLTKIRDQKIKGFINFYGPQNWMDLLRFSHDGDILDSKNNMKHFFGRDVHQEPEILREVSPYFKVDSSFPKTLNIHGKCDPLVPVDQTQIWSQKLRDLNVPHVSFYLPYATHVFDWSLHSPAGSKAAYLVQHFLKHLTSTEITK